jgi:hypothetical protein
MIRGRQWHVNSICDKYILQLYQEGVAMYFEQLVTGDPDRYHQSGGDWLEWCRAYEYGLNAEYLRRLEFGESCQDFFGDWCGFLGHSDTGYFIGGEFVKALAKKHTLTELACLSLPMVYEEFEKYVMKTKYSHK